MTTTQETGTQQLYDNQANDWSRREPILLSDFSARPYVLDMCEPLQGLDVLDLGCGEGYVSREMKKRGARSILGIDISEKMIQGARHHQSCVPMNDLEFRHDDVRNFDQTNNSTYHLVLAMFLFNYLSVADTKVVMDKSFRLLKSGGHFVFAVPHPLLAYLKPANYPFYFDPKGGYFGGRDRLFPGQIWRRDGIAVDVQCVHKTISDYFQCLSSVGFQRTPEVRELHITEEHIALDSNFFEPLRELPLHMAFKVQKN